MVRVETLNAKIGQRAALSEPAEQYDNPSGSKGYQIVHLIPGPFSARRTGLKDGKEYRQIGMTLISDRTEIPRDLEGRTPVWVRLEVQFHSDSSDKISPITEPKKKTINQQNGHLQPEKINKVRRVFGVLRSQSTLISEQLEEKTGHSLKNTYSKDDRCKTGIEPNVR